MDGEASESFPIVRKAYEAGNPVSEIQTTNHAVDFLQAEHRFIDEGFALYFLQRSEARWGDMLASTLMRLKVHMELEEELFYPFYFAMKHDDSSHHESLVEHEVVKKLIADIEHSDPADPLFHAMVRILWKIVARHFVEEESLDGMLMFREHEEADLLERLEERREQLIEWMSGPRSQFKKSPPFKRSTS